MWSMEEINADGNHSDSRRMEAGTDAVSITNIGFHFNVASPRTNPIYMDCYFGMTFAGNMPFGQFPLIRWQEMNLMNLPPWGVKMSDNKVGHFQC